MVERPRTPLEFPDVPDYDALRSGFTWGVARAALEGLPGGAGLNIAREAVDRHALGDAADRAAIRHLGASGDIRVITYAELRRATNRFATALVRNGVRRGDAVFGLTGRVPELFVAALGALKAGAVFCPLFSAFGPEPIRTRLALGKGRILVTTDRLYERKVAPIRDALPDLRDVVVLGGDAPQRTTSWHAFLAGGEEDFEIPPTDPEDPALLFFTSGTTGTPKGALLVHDAVVAQHATATHVLGLRPGDRYWCTADPGWVTGTVYGMVAPLVVGATLVVDEDEFEAQRWLSVLEREKVAVWYTAPTALRMMLRLGRESVQAADLAALRRIACVGEALDGETVHRTEEVFGQPVHDTWWQTETGAIMIANFPGVPIRPGAMGRPVPGIDAGIVMVGDDGKVSPIDEPDRTGQLALRVPWPSMFRAYVGDEARYRRCFADGWYLSGDLARRDADGWFWFVGRSDDVIKAAGHLIGPAEVEAVLIEHPAVLEAAVIGVPHPVTGEAVKAFVVLRQGFEPGDSLARDVLAHARRKLGPAVAPREVQFRPSLPRTRSGKILRRLLKARELGLPEGDLSTLERDEANG